MDKDGYQFKTDFSQLLFRFLSISRLYGHIILILDHEDDLYNLCAG